MLKYFQQEHGLNEYVQEILNENKLRDISGTFKHLKLTSKIVGVGTLAYITHLMLR